MRFLIVAAAPEAAVLEKAFGSLCPESILKTIVWPDDAARAVEEIRAFQPDLLITADLAGFELPTLRKGIFYNLLDCRSLHLLIKRDLENERLLGKQMSISMFFYCLGEPYYCYLKETYPDIPFLGMLSIGLPPGDEAPGERNAAAFSLADIFCRLREETGLPLPSRG